VGRFTTAWSTRLHLKGSSFQDRLTPLRFCPQQTIIGLPADVVLYDMNNRGELVGS
jgi:hypothetical protein